MPLNDNILANKSLKISERRFRAVVENGCDVTALLDNHGKPFYFSSGLEKITGYTDREVIKAELYPLIHPDDIDYAKTRIAESLQSPGTVLRHIAYRIKHKEGHWVWLENTFSNFLHNDTIACIVNTFRDITEETELQRKQPGLVKALEERNAFIEATLQNQLVDAQVKDAAEKKTNEAVNWYYHELDKLEKDVLELNAKADKSLSATLSSYLSGIEALHQGMLCSMQELKGTQIFNLCSPGLPDDFLKAIEGAQIGPLAGSCGTAAFLKQKVIVTDIAHDPRWKDYKESALRNHLKACWSYPIIDSQGNVMATFACYYKETRTPTNAEENTIQRAVHILQVILENYRHKQAVAEASEEKNTILESIDDAFFAVDKKWVVTYWNKMAAILLGKSSDQMLGHNLWDIFPDFIGSDSYNNYMRAVETNQAVHFEDYYPPYDTWLDISCYPSKNGLSIYFKDITQRKLIEHQLSAERNLLRTLIDNLPHSVYFKDEDARKLISNKVDYELLGAKTEAEVLGKTDLEVFLPAEIASFAYEQDIGILKSGKPLINHEHYFTTANGTWIAMLTTKLPLFNERNEVIGLLGIGRDITEQKLAEKKLRELNGQLEKNVKQLMVSNAELEQFAYVASHDLQEPLRMVSSFMAQLEKKYGDILDDKGRQYIHFAVDGAKRMKRIILDLLDFSKVGSREDDLEDVNFNKLVNEVLALYRRQAEELRANICVDDLPTIKTYKTPMRQVFQNLVSNSLKYRKPDVAPTIHISCKESKTQYQFSLKDNGIGIAPEYFDKIFVIFQRLHHKEEYPGTGMGLAITKKIIENLGGKIWVSSEEGNGSTFYFTLLKTTFYDRD